MWSLKSYLHASLTIYTETDGIVHKIQSYHEELADFLKKEARKHLTYVTSVYNVKA